MLTPGSASNWAERYLRLKRLLIEDISDAYLKLYCAALGAQSVLGVASLALGGKGSVPVSIPLFPPSATAEHDLGRWVGQTVIRQNSSAAPDIVDALVIWTRAMMRTLDRFYQSEIEMTTSIPVLPNASGGGSFSIQPAAFPFGSTLASVRLLAIGLSVQADPDEALPIEYTKNFPVNKQGTDPTTVQNTQNGVAMKYIDSKLARLTAQVIPPPQTSGHTRYGRPAIILSNVRVERGYSGDSLPAMYESTSLRNINPFSGNWQVNIGSSELAPYTDANSTAWIKGTIVHFRVRATLK